MGNRIPHAMSNAECQMFKRSDYCTIWHSPFGIFPLAANLLCMYEISIRRAFSAAHAIRLYDGSIEPVHGHNWSVVVTIAADALDEIEVVADFHPLEKHLDALLATANNGNLNDLPPFADGKGGLSLNPTAERVAWWIGQHMLAAVPTHARLAGVTVGEAPGCTATWRP
jgi:6-pyruvoyltetrahydropterin/6-carboxytetrahydropterin synthase